MQTWCDKLNHVRKCSIKWRLKGKIFDVLSVSSSFVVCNSFITMPVKDAGWHFVFNECGKLPPPVLAFHKVSFGFVSATHT